MKRTVLYLSFLFITNLGLGQTKSDETIPISTQWTLDAAGPNGRSTIPNIYLVYCPQIALKGTGFQLRTGEIITCAHVVKNSSANEIFCQNPLGKIIKLNEVITDSIRDLAILIPSKRLTGGLTLGTEDSLYVGNIVSTWGFPLGHNGPSPLLSVGYLSGFKNYQPNKTKIDVIKHLVVNGAFNSGNSARPDQDSEKLVSEIAVQ